MQLITRITIPAALVGMGLVALLASPARADVPNDPTVTITSPEDGTFYEQPTAIDVQFTITDPFAFDSVDLMLDGEVAQSHTQAPWDQDFVGVELSEGMHTLVVVLHSDFDYTSQTVNVAVGPAPSGTGTGTGTGGDTGTGGTDTTTGGDKGGSSKSGACSVTSTGDATGLLGLALLGLLVAARRRED